MAQTAMTVRMDNQQKEVKPQSSRLMKCKYPLNAVLHISKNIVPLHGGIIFLILIQEYAI